MDWGRHSIVPRRRQRASRRRISRPRRTGQRVLVRVVPVAVVARVVALSLAAAQAVSVNLMIGAGEVGKLAAGTLYASSPVNFR